MHQFDEAQAALGPRSGHKEEGVRTFGHIVVDEAQDLSPMEIKDVGPKIAKRILHPCW